MDHGTRASNAETRAIRPASAHLPSMTKLARELARIERGVAAHGDRNPLALSMARLLEAIRAVMLGRRWSPAAAQKPGGLPRPKPKGKLSKELDMAAAVIRRHAAIDTAYEHGALPSAMLHNVEALLDERKRSRNHVKLAREIAEAVEVTLQMNDGELTLFPETPDRGEKRILQLVPPIMAVLRAESAGSVRRAPGTTLAQKIVIACAQRLGHPRPSAFLDRERKREDRKYEREVFEKDLRTKISSVRKSD